MKLNLQKITQSLIDDIKNHIGKCWKLHIKNINKMDLDTIVSLKISTRSDGVVKEINQQLEQHHKGNEQFKIPLSSLISLASHVYDIFASSTNDEKRQLLG